MTLEEVLKLDRELHLKHGKARCVALIRKFGGTGNHPRTVPENRWPAYAAAMQAALAPANASRKSAPEKPPMTKAEIHTKLDELQKPAYRRFNRRRRAE